VSEKKRQGAPTDYLRIACTKAGESGQEEVKQMVQLTLQKELRRCKWRQAWKLRMVEIRKARYEDGGNVRIIQRGKLSHCAERRGRKMGGEYSGI